MDNRIIEAMEALQEQDGKVHALFDLFPQMIWTANPNGALDYINAPFYEYTGWQPGKAPGKEWLSVVHEDDHAISLERWNHSLETGSPYEVEYRIKRASDGAFIWHIVRAVPVKNREGKITKWIGTTVDIHKQKQVEEQLSRFVYIASHDLKAPVNNMKSLVELFKIQEKEDWGKLLELLEVSTKRLDETLQHLVARVKVPDEHEIGQLLKFDRVLDAVLARGLQKKLDGMGGCIEADFSQCPAIHYIESSLQLIFHTMISNALKYADVGRNLKLKIESSRSGDLVLLHFADNASGIDLDIHKNRIFSPFAQFHKDKSGKGVGLYLLKNMIVKNGGSIEVESQPGKGTNFKLFLKEYLPE